MGFALSFPSPETMFSSNLIYVMCPCRRLLVSSGAVIAYMVIITTELDQSAAIRLLQEKVNSGAFTEAHTVPPPLQDHLPDKLVPNPELLEWL